MEPTPETLIAIGKVCGAWSYLEAVTEQALWGILDAEEKLGPIISWRLDMRSRWQLILDHAPKKHDTEEMKELRAINKDLATITRDRNIIAHGLVHAALIFEGPRPPPGTHIDHPITDANLARVPCWTIFRGVEAGKNFPISTKAVEIVQENIQALARRVANFNQRHSYQKSSTPKETVEAEWPKPLE
jgi:hypothetical protein